MASFDLDVAPLHFPLVGNSIVVGFFSLLHIALAGLSVGFMLLAPLFQLTGRSIPFNRDLAHSVTRFTVVVFSVSTVLAVIMVELLIGLFPVTTMWMWNRFRGPIALGVVAFILQLIMLYPYYHFWEPLQKYSLALHITLGALAAGFMLLWVAMLDGMGSYMLTPVEGATSWDNMWNPTWGPLLLHRMVGNLLIAGYAIAAYGAWRSRRHQDLIERPYYLHLLKTGWTIGLTGLLLQPFTGLLYALVIGRTAPAAYAQLVDGPYRGFLYLQFMLIGLLFTGNHLLLKSTQASQRGMTWLDGAMVASALGMVLSVGHTGLRRIFLYLLVTLTLWSVTTRGKKSLVVTDASSPWLRLLAMSLGIVSLLVYLTMGTIRETARHPDTIRGKVSLHDEVRHQQSYRETSR